MMFKTLVVLSVAVVTGIVVHFASLQAMPGLIMGRATEVLKDIGVTENQWFLAARTTPEDQPIVRASPDLSYSVCIVNVADGPVRISAPGWAAYGSLSVFQDDTDNVYVGSLQRDEDLVVIVAKDGQAVPTDVSEDVIYLSSDIGVALIRRLAPTQEDYDIAAALIDDSTCHAVVG